MVKKIQYDLQWRWCFSLIKTSLSLSYTNSPYFIQHFVIRILCFSYLQSIISGSFRMFRFHTFVHLVYGKWEKEVTYNQNVCQAEIFCLQCIYRLLMPATRSKCHSSAVHSRPARPLSHAPVLPHRP